MRFIQSKTPTCCVLLMNRLLNQLLPRGLIKVRLSQHGCLSTNKQTSPLIYYISQRKLDGLRGDTYLLPIPAFYRKSTYCTIGFHSRLGKMSRTSMPTYMACIFSSPHFLCKKILFSLCINY